jgi:hypothetical protein
VKSIRPIPTPVKPASGQLAGCDLLTAFRRSPAATANSKLVTANSRPQGARNLAGKLLPKLVRKLAWKLMWKLGSVLASKLTSLHRDKLFALLNAKLGNKLAAKLSA